MLHGCCSRSPGPPGSACQPPHPASWHSTSAQLCSLCCSRGISSISQALRDAEGWVTPPGHRTASPWAKEAAEAPLQRCGEVALLRSAERFPSWKLQLPGAPFRHSTASRSPAAARQLLPQLQAKVSRDPSVPSLPAVPFRCWHLPKAGQRHAAVPVKVFGARLWIFPPVSTSTSLF